MAPKRIVQIGTGRWGRNYLKTFDAFPVTVEIGTEETWKSLIDTRPDGVVVCTPPSLHVEMAQYALERGIPVMVEKPLALSLHEAEQLAKYEAPILIDHLYLFSHGYQSLKQALRGKEITVIRTVGTGTKSHDDHSVLWDYGPHDIAMALDLMGSDPTQVSAKEIRSADVHSFEIELTFPHSIAVSRFGVAHERQRTVDVAYEGGKASYEDSGTETPSPLTSAVEVFLNAIDGKPDERLGLGLSLRVLRVLEACDRSLESGGSVAY